MNLYHVGSSRYARQLTGEGARLFGGRWNLPGNACLYTSGTRSLGILEYLANVSVENLPTGLAITIYHLPDELCHMVPMQNLPDDWAEVPAPTSTQHFGSRLLDNLAYVCFAVPSVIVPAEKNYILNPGAAGFERLTIVDVEPFAIDLRIKQ
jgi:RES domain-containing protein